MEGSSPSSLSEEDLSSKEHSLPEEENDLQSEPVEEAAQGECLLSGEEQLTLITESMSITSSDEEKLQLLNKNTELRRLNKELMKLNEEWDHIYHSTSVGLQQRVADLEEESRALKQLNSRLLLKVEHEQNKREYYEQTLMQELKKNQHLQEYVRLLESRLHQTDLQQWTRGTQTPDISGSSDSQLMQSSSKLCTIRSTPALPPSLGTKSSLRLAGMGFEMQSNPMREVQDLKEQLVALQCQTKIYEADYKTEQKDHERMLQENKRLRRREADMRQQMALLQEQLKVYEDDFQKERSDKRILQRLLMKKSPAEKEPVLVHRCNNEQDRPRSDRRKPREEQRGGYVCPKHCERHGQPEFP
ncbi:spindle assembly checkpoint component mad1 isoform X1 [Sinocyclocheilus grahami]|uniref:spindle assembly checkpoint component mad1 isoform X1 n=2 Tax=Sinocyclocheilus grahami TaxID=75366 RepID=UPI0007ACBE2A|nr:PREDICTED: spindle assembly checkpoint component mad1-like isoform X1 [Sinocyclocheilus grahami]